MSQVQSSASVVSAVLPESAFSLAAGRFVLGKRGLSCLRSEELAEGDALVQAAHVNIW